MNKKNVKLTLIILFIIFISIATVNADDTSVNDVNSTILNDNSTLTNEDTSNHTHTELSKILSDPPIKKSTITAPGGTFTDLQTILSTASSGDTISFTGDYIYNSGTDSALQTNGININNLNLIFEGNGHKLDGSDVATLFTVSDSTITFKNLQFLNFYRNNHGAVISATDSNFTLINSLVKNITSPNKGGFVYSNSSSYLTLINSQFYDVNVLVGAAAYFNTLNGDLTISNSVFENLNIGGGGVVQVEGNVNGNYDISNSIFRNIIDSSGHGGIFYVNGNLMGDFAVNTCDFENVDVSESGGIIFVNGIMGDVNVSNSNFTNVVSSGGGIFQIQTSVTGDFNLVNSRFKNVAVRTGHGGVIYVHSNFNGDFIADNCIFDNVSAYANGGVVYFGNMVGDFNVSNSTFIGVTSKGGGILQLQSNCVGDFNFINSTFKDIAVYPHNGGVLYIGNSMNGGFVIDNCNFTNVTANGNGSFAYVKSGCTHFNVSNSIFDRMYGAYSTFCTLGSMVNDISFINSNFSNIYGSGSGVIQVEGNVGGSFIIVNSTFNNFSAGGTGGIFVLNNGVNGNIIFNNSNFSNFKAGNNAGVGWVNGNIGGNLSISNSKFVNGTSTNHAGVFYLNGAISGSVSVYYSNFSNFMVNVGSGYSGLIYLSNGIGGDVDVVESHFENVYSGSAGGIISTYYGVGGNVSFVNSSFKNVTSKHQGGVFYAASVNGYLEVLNSNFKDVGANSHGGIFYVNGNIGNYFNISNSNFSNFRTGDSGAVSRVWGNIGGDINIFNSSFVNGTSNNHAGVIYTDGSLGGGVYVNYSNFTNFSINVGSGYSGLIYVSNGISKDVSVFDSRFENVYSGSAGGIISSYSNVGGNATFINSYFNNITSKHQGGIFYAGNIAGDFNISNCTVLNFRAGVSGGFGWVNNNVDGNINVIDSVFINGSAGQHAGVIYVYKGVGGSVNVTSSNFSNFVTSASSGYGGLIYFETGAGGNVSVFDSNFENVTAGDAGAIISSYGTISGNVNLSNSSFKNLWSQHQAGALCTYNVNGYFVVESCDFYNVSSNVYGGVFCILGNVGNVSICDSNFSYVGSNQQGGVFYTNNLNGDFNIIESNFSNFRTSNCGAIGWINNNLVGNINITDSIFVNGTADSHSGVIYVNKVFSGSIIIHSSNFSNFIIKANGGYGGLIYSESGPGGNVSICDSNFENVTANDAGAIISTHETIGGNVNLSNSSFKNLWSRHQAGVLCANNVNGYFVVESCDFYNVSSNVYGGVFSIFNNAGNVTVFDSNFSNVGSNQQGGIFYIKNVNGDMYILNCTVFNASSSSQGGVVYINDGVNNFYVLDSSFINVSANSYSFVYAPTSNAKINNNVIIVNDLTKSAVYSNGDLNNNWWGLNVPDFNTLIISSNKPETWVVMGFTNTTLISTGSSPTNLLVSLDTIYNYTSATFSSLNHDLPINRTVFYNTTIPGASFTDNNINFLDNVTNKITYSSIPNNWLITATIDYQTLPLGPGSFNLNISVSKNPVHLYEIFNYTFSVSSDYSFTNVSIFSNISFIYLSSSGYGSYNSSTGVWFIDSVNSTTPRNITISVRVPYNQSLVNKTVNTRINTTCFVSLNYLSPIIAESDINVTVLNITGGSYTLFQSLIDATPENGTLNMSFNVTYDPDMDGWLQGGMQLNKSITILGNNFTIDGIGQARMFKISADNVSVSNITYMNGYAIDGWADGQVGGSAIANKGLNLNITYSTFFNCTAKDTGPIQSTSNGITSVDHCYFLNNTCDRWILNINSANSFGYITNSLFEGNKIYNSKYAIVYVKEGIINNNAFINNTGGYLIWRDNNGANGNLEYNWYGTNDPNLNNLIRGNQPETWVIMNFTASNFINPSSGTINLTTTLNTIYNNTNKTYRSLPGTIPQRTVTYTANTGTYNTSTSKINQTDNVTFIYSSTTNLELNATIDNQILTLRITNVTGCIVNVSKTEPQIGDYATFTLNVTNTGDNNIIYSPGYDGLVVKFTIPWPFYFLSQTGDGFYDNGYWFVGNLSVNQSKTIKITTRVPYNTTFVGMNVTFNMSLAWGHFLTYEDQIKDHVNLTLQNKTTGSYTDLQEFIDNTPENGTLIMPFNVTYDPIGDAWLQTGMKLNKTITILGNGHIISGEDQARIFLVTAGNVTLDNIIYTNGRAIANTLRSGTEGAAIASCGDNLTITNSIFKNGYSNDRAAAILTLGSETGYSYTRAYISNCSFINNSCPNFLVNAEGDELYLHNCIFENNTMSGQTVWIHGIGNITHSIFVNNNNRAIQNAKNQAYIENNWYGTNTPNFSSLITGTWPETYVIMNFTNTTPINYTNGTSNLLVTLNTVFNTTDNSTSLLIGYLPSRIVYFNWTHGNINPNITNITGSINTNFDFIEYPNMYNWTVNATIDNQMLWIGGADIGINIMPSIDPIDDGENITYIVSVVNNGPMNSTDINVTLNLPLNGLIILNITVNYGYYNNTTGIWEIGNLTVGQNVTMEINATLADPGPLLIWNATVNYGSEYDYNHTNNTFITNVTVNQIADLEIHKNISNPQPQTRENVTYVIVVYNNGPSTAINVTIFDNLSDKLVYQFSNATKGEYNETTGIWFIENMTPYSNETLNITVTINNSGFINNFVNVTSNITDNNLTNNYDNVSFETPPLSDLWVTITMEPQSSNYITYHIQAGNNGIEPANGTVVVFNLSNLYIWFNHTTDKGIYNNDTGVWDIGYLDVNETVNMTLIVRLDFPTGTTFANITTSVNITSWSTDLYPENNTDNVTFEAEIFGNFRLLQDIVDSWPENTTQILPRSFAYDPIQDAPLPGETYDLINGVRLYKNITIINPYGFTLGGFDMARIFNISADNIILDGLRFYNGYSPLGAALNIHANNVKVLRSNFSNNRLYGDYGAAIFTSGANTLIMDNLFTENSATKLGGGIGAVGATNLQILNNTFINNTVESDEVFGGAVGIINSTATVNGNVFLDNQAINAPNLGSAIYTDNSNVNLEANWFGNNTPDMIDDHLIWGVKPETYIILDWEIVNPNMIGVTLDVVFVLYNHTSGIKTPIGYGIPDRYLTVNARDPTLSWYNSTFTGNNTLNYTYNTAIPIYQINATVDYETITLEWSTFLSVNKTLLNDTIWFGDDLIYNITLINYGPHDSYTITISDLLPTGLTINNVTPTKGSTSIIGDNVYWTLVANAGNTETLIVNVTPESEKTYINNITVNSTNPYDYFIWGNMSVKGEVLPLFDLSINFTISNPPYYVGEEINYTITIHNKGPSNATNVSVYIPIPSGLTFLYAWNLIGYIPDYNSITGLWNVSTLEANETIQINMTLRLDNAGWYNQTVNITGYGVELNETDNNKTISFNVTTQVDLELNMTISTNETFYGNLISITYSLLNKGPSPAINTTVFTLFSGLTYSSSTGYGSFNNITPFTGYWYVGNLNNGSLVTRTLYFYANSLGEFTVTGRANCSDNESYWPDNYANVTLKVIKYADLSITKTVSNSTPFLEQVITYTITVTNLAGFTAENVTVYDPLPTVLIYNNSNPEYNGTHWFVGNLTVGETRNLTFNVTVDGIGIIWNNVTVNSSVNDSNPNNNHAEVSVSVPVGDDLRMYINVIPTTPSSNAAFIINLSVWNRGFTDNQNVTVEFHIPAGLIYLNSTNMGAYNPGTGLWYIGFLGNGSWTNLEIWVYPNTIGNITLEANVSGQVVDIAPGNNRANLTFEIVPSFDLAVTKTANTTLVDDGDLIGFDIIVWNKGPYQANDVKVIDYLPNGLLYYSNNASGIYDNNTRTVNWTISTLNMGDVFTFHLTCKVWNPGISFTNTITVDAYGTDSNLTDNTATVTVNVTQNNDLEVRINASKTNDIDLGETIIFYITVINHGPSNATNVIAQFDVPSIFTYLSDNSGGYYIPSTGEWLIGNLESGKNTTLIVVTNLTSLGMCTANTTVNSTYTDKNLTNNYDELNITATPLFDLNITAYWNLTNNTLIWSELANLTIIVSNKGPENASNVTVQINVPGVSYINDTSMGKLNTTTWTWNVGNLSVGEYKNITITFKGIDCGFYWTNGNITGHGYDNNTEDNNYTLNLSIIPVVDLVMTNLTVNTTYAGVDEILEFNVTVYNKGPCNATNVTIVGFLPLNWTFYGGNLIADIPVNTSHTFNILINATTCGNFTVGFNATIHGVDNYPLDNNRTIGPIEIIYHADLMITIKVNNNQPVTGDMVVYVITVSNLGWRTAHNVTANITIPSNLTLDHYYLASGVYNSSNGTWIIGNMSFRNSTTMFLFARVNTPGNTDFWVNVSGDDYDFNLENNNDTTGINAIPGLDLNITISTSNNTPYTGDNLTFTVNVENIGCVNATGVTVDIDIPLGFINPTSNDLNFTGTSWFIGNLNVGASKTLTFKVIPVTTSTSVFNVSVSADKVDFNVSNNFDNISISPISASDLQVHITCNNTNLRLNENVTYAITIHNNGLIDVNNVMVYNNLPFTLTYTTSTPLYNPTTGMWMISNLPAGATETLNITINHTNTGIFNYTVNITGNTIETNITNNIGNITVLVADDNDLKVEFTVSNTSVIDEGILNFTITVINDGFYNNTNIMVHTDLPSTGIYNSSEIFDTVSGIWNVGNLSAGENKTLTLTVNLTGVGNYTYWANATGDQSDRNYSNNNQSLNVSIYADYDLKVNISGNTSININDTSTLIITVTNYGPSTAYNVQVLNDITGILAGISKGTYSSNIWNISNLTSGETQTLNLTIKPALNGTYTYNVEVTADNFQYDRNNTNNKDNITINVTNIVDLIINITSNKTIVNKTEIVEFTITIYNNASITANNVLIETENLFSNLISVTSSTGFVSSNSWLILSLAPNTTETLKITRTINNNTLIKVNVSSNNQEKDNSTNFANTTVYVVKETDLSINITANTSNSYIGDNVTFTITVTNLGNETAENVTVHLDLPYTISYDNVYMYDSQQGIWLIGQLENNTSINFNVTATINTPGIITYNATVNATTFDINLLNNYDNVTLNITSILDLEICIALNTTSILYSTDSFMVFVNVTNYGPSNATGVIVNLNIPGTTFTTANGTYSGGIWSIGNLPTGETAYLNITCNLTSTNNGIYYANVTSTEKDKNTTNNNATINLTIIDISDLEVTITTSTNETDIHNSLIYTVTLTNHGPDTVNDAIVNIKLPNTFNITSNMSSNGIFNGTHWILSSLGTGFSGIANLYITGNYNSYGNQTAFVSVNSSNRDDNNTNNQNNISVWITPVTDLMVNFTSTGYYNPDGTITFNITVTNNGPCNATDLKLYTDLNPSISYNESIGYFDTLQNIWYISQLNAGESETLIINTTYISGTEHYANITSSTKELNNTNNIKYINFTITPLADLSVNITVNNSNPLFGETVTFTITATNLGPYNATNVIVNTDLPASPIYTASKGLFSTVTGNWSIGNLSVGETATLKIIINATSDLWANANITGSVNDTNTSNNNATVNITLKPVADLSINLTLNQSNFLIWDNITITLNITNIGPNIAENITINTTLPTGFIPDSIYSWNLTNLTNNTSIEFNITGILTTDGIKTIEANIISNTYDNNTSNNYDSISFTVENTVDLLIEITSNTSNILAGETVNIIVNVTNIGNGTAQNIIVSTNIFNATGDKTGYYDKDTGYWYIGNLTSNQTVNLNLTVQIIENTTYIVSVNTTNVDINASNNNDTLNITVTPVANLNIIVETNSEVLYLEDELIYTIFVTNKGYSIAENVTVIINSNATNFTLVYCNDTNFNNLSNVWDIGNLPVGKTSILILKYFVNTTGNFTINFNTTTTTNETNLTDNIFNITVYVLNSTKPVNNLVDLIINITSDNSNPSINSTVNINITVFNNATTTATNLTILNFLPTGLTPVGIYTGEWNISSLPAYSNISFTFTVNVTNYGSFVNNASVDCIEWDSNPINNRANTLIVCNAPTGDYTDLQINITRTGNLTINELIKYIVNVTNAGSTLATDVNVTIIIFEGLNYTSDNSTGSYSFTNSLWNVGNLNQGASSLLEITLNITKAGYYNNAFLVYNNQMDSNPQNNLVLDSFQINDSRVDVNIRINANKTYVTNNETILFTVTVTNPSLNTAHDVNVTLDIPDEFVIVSFVGNDTNSSYYIGNLTAGSMFNFTFVGKLNSTNSSMITVNVTLNETDYNLEDNVDSVTILPLGNNTGGVADLCVNITVNEQYPDVDNDVPTFNVWVTNFGPDNATNVEVPIHIPGDCISTSADVYWDNSTSTFRLVNLSVGQTVKFEVSFRIGTLSPIIFNASASCDQFDPNITDNKASIPLYPWKITPYCDLNITIVPVGSEFYANSTVSFNVTIRNFANYTAENVTISNIVPSGLTLVSVTSNTPFVQNGNSLFIKNITRSLPVVPDKYFILTYNIPNKGLYQTTMEVNSSTLDVDSTNNGMGVAIYAGEAEPERVNITTRVLGSVSAKTLNGDANWTFTGTLKKGASPGAAANQNFANQTLYANITSDGNFSITVEAIGLTGSNGVVQFSVNSAQLMTGAHDYTVTIFYKGVKTNDTYYLPSVLSPSIKRKVTVNP